jgi:hypothetical protein
LVRFALGKEIRRVFEVGDSILSTINKQSVELVPAPLNAMLNLVGEVAESAHGDGLLWRILRVTIAECLVGDNHLRVGFGSKSARFEEGFLVPDAFAVNVETGLDIINGINYEIKAFPKFVIEDFLSLRGNKSSVSLNVEVGVHNFSNTTGGLRFGMADIALTEEELTVQV